MNAIGTDIQALVLGFGNPLRGDDGVGWFAARQLADLVDPDHVAALAVHQLTPELAEPISRVGLVVFIDASCGHPPGFIACRTVEPSHDQMTATHQCSPGRLLSLAQTLYGRAPHAYLFTVNAETFEHSESLSPVVESACAKLVHRVRDLVTASLEFE